MGHSSRTAAPSLLPTLSPHSGAISPAELFPTAPQAQAGRGFWKDCPSTKATSSHTPQNTPVLPLTAKGAQSSKAAINHTESRWDCVNRERSNSHPEQRIQRAKMSRQSLNRGYASHAAEKEKKIKQTNKQKKITGSTKSFSGEKFPWPRYSGWYNKQAVPPEDVQN